MLRPLCLLAAGIAGNLAAQPTPVRFGITPDADGAAALFTSRSLLGAQAGEILQEVPAQFFAGVGTRTDGTGCEAVGAWMLTQDQDRSTRETFWVVVRAAAGGGVPDCSAPPICRIGPLQTPAVAGTGPVLHELEIPFPTPCAIPACATYYVGIEVDAAPTWPADGQSLLMSRYRNVSTSATDVDLSDTPCPTGARNLGFHCLNGVPGTSGERVYWIGLLVASPVLNMGGADPDVLTGAPNHALNQAGRGGYSYGAGGMFLCCGPQREAGVRARVRCPPDPADPTLATALLLGSPTCPGLPLAPLAAGALYLVPTGLLVVGLGGPPDAAGDSYVDVLPPQAGACQAVLGRTVDFQAFCLSQALRIALSNRASVAFH